MKTSSPVVTLLLVPLLLSARGAEDPNKLTPESAFKKANSLMEKGQHKDAIPYLKRVQKELPENTAVLWNLGIALAETGSHRDAIEIWQTYRKIAPAEWQPMTKLVQSYQALGDFKARDKEVQAIYDLRKNSPTSEAAKAERYCREQWVTAGRKVFAFEYFEPQGTRRKFLRFSVVDKEGREDFYLSLGSYDDTTSLARELGQIPNTSRIYHLDEYNKTGHKTYAFFRERPGYEEVRTNVVKILRGELKPVSSTLRKRSGL